jgi:lipoprotein-anchoring transpeptidase ErfK/SrfK
LLAVAAAPQFAFAHKIQFPDRFLPQLVNSGRRDWEAGSVHVIPDDYFLYFMLNDGLAIRYGVGVGRKGLYKSGTFTVARKAKWPWWRPTNAMIRREPHKYARYKNGLKGGPNNPLGARAIYLYDEAGRDTYLRIHGTNEPRTIGSAVSNGCARLTNEHVKDLYERVEISAKVHLHPKGLAHQLTLERPTDWIELQLLQSIAVKLQMENGASEKLVQIGRLN